MKVLFVLLIGTFVEIEANECGQLTFASNYVTEGEIATLILNSPLQTTQRNWKTYGQMDIGYTSIFNSSTPETVCKYAEEKYENGYKLHIYLVDRHDEGYYNVLCHLPGGRKVWSKTSPRLITTANSSRENDCGILIARQTDVIERDDFELSFKSYHVQQNINWQKVTNDQFTNINNSEVRDCGNGITLLKVEGSGTWYAIKETYRVSCGQTFSNVVNITKVRFPPTKPTFLDVRDIHECKKCISAQVSNPVTVKCNTSGGSQQWKFKMFIGGQMIQDTFIDKFERKTLTYDFTPTIQDINAEFKCIVQNPDALEELVDTAKVLIYVKPSRIEVTGLSVKENQHSEIQCTTYGGRPQLQPTVFINNKSHHLHIIENISTGNTYKVRAGINKTFSRRNNNQSVSCCVDLLVGSECTKNIQLLHVSFPPIEIEVKEIYKNITEDGNANITLTCDVGASNPPSSIVWTEGFNIPVTIGELVSEAVLTFNLTRIDNGREIHCTAFNTEFSDQNISAIYVANITYGPLITISGPENRTVYVGDYVGAMCYVDSNPESKIVWLNETERLLEDIGNRLPLVFLASGSMKGLQTYTCIASNNIGGTQRKHLHFFIEDRPINESGSSLDRHWTIGIVCTVSGILACFMVTMIIVMIRKRRKEQTPEPTTRSDNVQNTESDASGNISENPVAYDSLLQKSERNTGTVDQEYLPMMISNPGGDEEEREHVYDN